MNTFQNCRNTSDAIPLYLPLNLYLKPIARLNISVQLPHEIEPGKSVSNWEIMEKLRQIIRPEEFSVLKAVKNTLEFIRFEAEIDDKTALRKTIALLEGRTIKLAAFSQNVKIRAAEAKCDFPTSHSWDSFFRDAKNMDEMKPGERPDTIHLSNFPIKWFVPSQHKHKDGIKPSLKIFHRIFEKFGHIRHVDIPICDSYRSKMKEHINGMKTFTFEQDDLFEGYVQFKDYIGFRRAMDAFRGMKLLKNEGNDNAQTVNIIVDFDKTKHLSDASIRRRQIVRERLIAKDREREEKEKEEKNNTDRQEEEKRRKELEQKEAKEKRRREREEKRKARHFEQLKLKETEELKKKIAKEEVKLLKVQRKLEAIRLIEELFKRIELKREKDAEVAQYHVAKNSSKDELTKFKIEKELKVKQQREKLNKALEGHVVLNSILENDNAKKKCSTTDSSSDSDFNEHNNKKHKKKKKKDKKKKKSETKTIPSTVSPRVPDPNNTVTMSENNWYVPSVGLYPYPTPMYRPHLPQLPPGFYPPPPSRQFSRGGNIGGPRGQYNRRRGYNSFWNRGFRGRRGGGSGRGMLPDYPDELTEEYYKYFQKFLREDNNEHDNRRSSRSYTRSKSRTRSRSRSRSRTRSKSRSRTRNRKYSSSSSSSSSSSRSKSKNYNRNRNRNRRSRSRNRSIRSRTRSRSRAYTRSRNRSRNTSRADNKSRSVSRTRDENGKENRKTKSKDRSPSYRSIDSSKFISPSRLRSKRSRSKSWSLPRNLSDKRCSWSKSPSPIKK